jgi:hypothetical protein
MKSFYKLLFVSCLFVACTVTDSTPEEETVPPEAANLIFPEDDTECNTGVEVNDTQSSVTFRWENAGNADSYEVFVTESSTNEVLQFEAPTNEAEIIINKATVYEWYVVSKSENTDETAISETWRFYNAGDGEVNHAPFSADALFPEVGTNLANTEQVTVEWEGSDIDDDIVSYEVYFGVENPPTMLLAAVSSPNHSVDVVSGTTYYWSIKTIDAADNSSESDVFWFKVD